MRSPHAWNTLVLSKKRGGCETTNKNERKRKCSPPNQTNPKKRKKGVVRELFKKVGQSRGGAGVK